YKTITYKRTYLFPPRESCKRRVSLESRYGTCVTLPDAPPSALITLPNASSPQLILIPSFARSPVAPVRLSLSDPARSTK
uniref:EMI domain-containing protein n=1 Tax=Ascaris lumbricoides TaxID=6252 RepID=A0A0M3HHD0_ASCLU